eukprot:1263778-Pyramimonas_sp.AAC.1
MSGNQQDARPGLGTDRTTTDGVYCRKWLYNIFCMTRFWGIIPGLWNVSKCFALPKAAAPGPKGKRAVHGLDPVGKGFFEGLMRIGPKYTDSDCDRGFLRARRREDAIVTNMCFSWRLSQAGYSWVDSLKDLSNAFASSKWEALDQATRTLVQPRDLNLCRQRFRRAGCVLPAADGPLFLRPGCGSLQGDPYAVRSFVRVFRPP